MKTIFFLLCISILFLGCLKKKAQEVIVKPTAEHILRFTANGKDYSTENESDFSHTISLYLDDGGGSTFKLWRLNGDPSFKYYEYSFNFKLNDNSQLQLKLFGPRMYYLYSEISDTFQFKKQCFQFPSVDVYHFDFIKKDELKSDAHHLFEASKWSLLSSESLIKNGKEYLHYKANFAFKIYQCSSTWIKTDSIQITNGYLEETIPL